MISDLALLLVVFRVTLRQASMAVKGLSLPEILRPSGHLPAFGGRPAGRVSHFPSASQRSSAPVTLQQNLVIKMKALKKMIYSGLRETDRQTDRQTETERQSQTDRQTDRETESDRQTDRQTEKSCFL